MYCSIYTIYSTKTFSVFTVHFAGIYHLKFVDCQTTLKKSIFYITNFTFYVFASQGRRRVYSIASLGQDLHMKSILIINCLQGYQRHQDPHIHTESLVLFTLPSFPPLNTLSSPLFPLPSISLLPSLPPVILYPLHSSLLLTPFPPLGLYPLHSSLLLHPSLP